MAKFPTYEEMAQNVAEKALDEIEYNGKTIRQWIEVILATDTNVGTTDTISRQAAIDAVRATLLAWSFMPEWRDNKIIEAIEQLPTIHPETAKRIIGKSRGGMTLWYQCNVCNEPVDEKDAYCRGCGRRLIDG